MPQRSEPPKSAVTVSGGRSSTDAMVAADCFSLYGAVVEAKYTAPTVVRSAPSRQSRAAATAMVRLSSS